MGKTVGYPIEDTRKLKSKASRQLVQEARQKLLLGQRHRQQRETLWERSQDQYEGKHWEQVGTTDENADHIVVNMSFSTINVILPYMTGSEPRFLVIPYSGDATTRNAAIQQALVNRLWRSRQVSGKKHTKATAWDFLVLGDGFLKVGYTIKSKRTAVEEYADIAELWVDRVSPWDVWIDPMSDGVHNARWVCQRLWITRSELEADEAYRNTNEENVGYGWHDAKGTSSAIASSDRPVENDQDVYDGSEYALVYEFYDRNSSTLIVFAEGEYPLRIVEDIEECPIVQLPNYQIPNSPWHMGELEQIWDLQMELNMTRSHLVTHRRRNVAKIFARRGALSQDAIQALQSGVVNDIAFVDGDQVLEDLVRPLDLPNLSGDAYNVSELMRNDIFEITGVNEYLRGASPDIRRTATEASIIEGASNMKSQFKLGQIEEMLKEVGFLLLSTAKDVYPKTEYDELQLFLTGRDAEAVQRADMGEQAMGMEQAGDMAGLAQIQQQMTQQMNVTVSPSPDIFAGEYEVEVESHSTELRNPVLREQKAREMATQLIEMAPLLMQLGVMLNWRRLLEEWFKAAALDDVDGLLEGMPPPMQMGAGQGMAGPEGAGAPMPGAPPPALQDPSMMGLLDSGNTGAFPPA